MADVKNQVAFTAAAPSKGAVALSTSRYLFNARAGCGKSPVAGYLIGYEELPSKIADQDHFNVFLIHTTKPCWAHDEKIGLFETKPGDVVMITHTKGMDDRLVTYAQHPQLCVATEWFLTGEKDMGKGKIPMYEWKVFCAPEPAFRAKIFGDLFEKFATFSGTVESAQLKA